MPLNVRVLNAFVDRPYVARQIDRLGKQVLVRAGAYARGTARGLIKKKDGPSLPHKPPHAHSGEIRLIFFAWEQASESVVAGPIRLGTKKGRAPEVLEHGGIVRIKKRDARGRKRWKRVRVEARPYMYPALKITAKRIPGLIRGSTLG